MSSAAWTGPLPRDIAAWNLVQVGHLVGQRFITGLAVAGLTPTQFGTLLELDLHPAMSNNEIARAVLVTPQTMSELLGSLQALGLIDRDRSAGRGHRVPIQLTAQGREVLRRCADAVDSVEQSLGLDGTGRDALNDLLRFILTAAI